MSRTQFGTADPRGVLALVLAATVVVAALLAGFWSTSSAGAQGTTCTGYAPSSMTVTPSQVAPGGTVTVAGVALPNATVTITLRKPDQSTIVLATGTASATGAFSIPAVIPADLPAGTYELIGTAPGCPTPFTVVVTVTPPGGVTTTTTASTTSTTSTTVAGGTTPTVVGFTPTSVSASVQEAGSDVLGATETQASATETASADDGALAFTGGEVRPFIVAAIAIIAVGALLVGSSRRRDS